MMTRAYTQRMHWPVMVVTLLAVMGGLPSCYLTRQAYYQNNLINSRQPVSHIIADPGADPATKDKLRLLQKVKAYAALHGLNSDGAYDSFVDNGSGAMSYLVFAAPIDKLKAKTWWFPIVGSVPYLGFFEQADRDAESADLKAAGLDVYDSESMAFSSLGYFEDPVYSSQFRYPDSSFSHTIFHELVHRTIWVPGSTRFNENLAEFVADQLNSQFRGDRRAETEGNEKSKGRLAERIARKKKLISFVEGAKADLETFYQGEGPKLLATSRNSFLAAREKILAAAYKKYYNPTATSSQQAKVSKRWNNARLAAASLYLPDYEIFAKAYACTGSDVLAFIAALKQAVKAAKGQTPEIILASLCLSKGS